MDDTMCEKKKLKVILGKKKLKEHAKFGDNAKNKCAAHVTTNGR
jgi:hypothetical protein